MRPVKATVSYDLSYNYRGAPKNNMKGIKKKKKKQIDKTKSNAQKIFDALWDGLNVVKLLSYF